MEKGFPSCTVFILKIAQEDLAKFTVHVLRALPMDYNGN